MVKIVRDMENKIPIKVDSLIDYTGFSAELEVNGITKSVSNLATKSPYIVFSAGEVESLNPAAFGIFTVYNKKGEVHIVYKIYFSVVDNQIEIQQFKPIRIVIVGAFKYEGMNAASDEVITKKVEEAVEKAMDESVGTKVEEVVDSIIDDKVEESVSGIIDPKVEAAVDAVIDTKVEKVVNDIFDSSESGTVGGVISGLQDKVEDDLDPRLTNVENDVGNNVKPRLSAAETTLAQKISLDYDESDDNIAFHEGHEMPFSDDETSD